MGGSLLAAASAGDCRNVKGPCPALRPGRLCGAFRFRELVPCFGPRPAAFNSLRSCSLSPRRRSISLSACSNCSRKPRFSASYSFSCLRRSSCLEPSIAPYRDTKPPKCPAFPLINYVNRLFKRKSVELNLRNELTAKLENGEPFDLKNLSSGEKQLVIILGEALLQHGAPSVYLADEPELSLHVEWQERLVSSIRELNSGAQLVFATHSPDIVSEYGDRVIDMEAVLQ